MLKRQQRPLLLPNHWKTFDAMQTNSTNWSVASKVNSRTEQHGMVQVASTPVDFDSTSTFLNKQIKSEEVEENHMQKEEQKAQIKFKFKKIEIELLRKAKTSNEEIL